MRLGNSHDMFHYPPVSPCATADKILLAKWGIWEMPLLT